MFEARLRQAQANAQGVTIDTDVPAEGLSELCGELQEGLPASTPASRSRRTRCKQLERAIEAVFRVWMADRAVTYRHVEKHPRPVRHRRERPVDGLRQHGRRPRHRRGLHARPGHRREQVLRRVPHQRPGRRRRRRHPHAAVRVRQERPSGEKRCRQPIAELVRSRTSSRSTTSDVQDIEFTIEQGTLFMLQTRNGKRTGAAAVQIACDMVKEKLIDEKTAVLRIPAGDLDAAAAADASIRRPAGEDGDRQRACPRRRARRSASSRSRLPKPSTQRTPAARRCCSSARKPNPEDIDGMHSAVGILTSTGGMTGHAAVVARGWGLLRRRRGIAADRRERRRRSSRQRGRRRTGDIVSIDGSTGEVMEGAVPMTQAAMSGRFRAP